MYKIFNIKVSLISVALLCCLSHSLFAQLDVDLEIRPRAEFRNGFKSLKNENQDPAFFIEQRSRLYINFKEKKYSIRLVVQDVRLWGENSQIFKTDNALFNVFEAWAAYNFSETSLIKVGRQALDYDNARILGDLAWAQQARSHDLVKYEYNGSKFKLHAGLAFNQEDVNANQEPARLQSTFFSGVNNYKTLQYLWLNQKYEAGNTSFLFLNNGVQAPDSTVNFSQTAGFYSKNKFGKFGINGEFYYQFGQAINGQDLSAFLASLEASIIGKTQTLSIGFDYLTGTEQGATTSNSFTPLYGTNHKFYGFMDFFFVGSPFGNVGLTDLFVKAKFNLSEKSALIVHAHEFFSEIDLAENFPQTNSNRLGTEVDLVYNINLDKAVNLKIGYSHLFATPQMELLKGGDSELVHNWAWAMFTFKPRLFSSKKDE